MKFVRASRARRLLKKLNRQQDMFKWQVYFAWLPVRFDETTVVWLERVARRRALKDAKVTRLGRFSYYHCRFDYGPVTNVLMQPGVGDVFGTGNSGAQASGYPVQGGPMPAPGSICSAVPIQGAAYASGAPPGGLNIITPQPRP